MSSKLSVGIHILTVLALEHDDALTSEAIGRSVNTNPVVIRRLLGRFRRAGYVGSKTGVGGGWVLRTAPERITVLDVLRAVEPQHAIFALHRSVPNPKCPVGCNIQGVLTEIYAEAWQGMANRLAGSTIADVLRGLRERSHEDTAG